MAIGPVQLLVLGFEHPDFHGEIIEELERLRESDTVKLIDSLAVYKDAAGEIEVMHLSNLSRDEAIELGSKVGALIGLGIEGDKGVEAGALLTDTTADDLAATMHPKVNGARVLHEMFPPGQLDWMVLFSSCGYLAGFPGQGAYACANAYLDAFAHHRRALGDRTTSVAWTAWRGLGMGSASGFVAAQLDALGMGSAFALPAGTRYARVAACGNESGAWYDGSVK